MKNSDEKLEDLLIFSINDVSEGQVFRTQFSVTDEDMAIFAVMSGDYNPIHINEEFAIKNGFEGEVVYGGLLLAKLSALIGMKLSGVNVLWLYTAIEFRKPVYVCKDVCLIAEVHSVSVATETFVLSVQFIMDEMIVAKGKAGVKVL